MERYDEDRQYHCWLVLLRTAEIILRARDKELEPYGLTASQAAVLYTIDNLGDRATVGNISKWLFKKPHTVSGILDRMERLGLVVRIMNHGQKGRVFIEMTPKGQKAREIASKRETIHAVMSVLQKSELEELERLLEAINAQAAEVLRASAEI